MEILKKLLALVDGNKTLIGMFLLWIVEKTWFVDFAGVAVVDVVGYVGAMLAGIGVVHKGMKMVKKPDEPVVP